MDSEIEKIAKAMDDQGKSRAALGRLLGLDSSQVSRVFATEGRRRRLQVHEMRKIEEWLGWAPGQSGATPGGAVVPFSNMVPLYGWVGATSENRLTIAEQSLRGYVPMHPGQAQLRDAFALEVADISMLPRYEPGEIVYLAPHRWPSKGKDCVVVTTSGEGYLKRFVGRDERKITLQQLNPEDTFDVPLDKLEAIHTVVGRG